jgi:hypothetical protein
MSKAGKAGGAKAADAEGDSVSDTEFSYTPVHLLTAAEGTAAAAAAAVQKAVVANDGSFLAKTKALLETQAAACN